MSYSNEYKVFWYLPKRTATRSIRPILNYFNFIDSDNHNFFTEEFQLSYYFISNVRNPYSRSFIKENWCDDLNKLFSENITNNRYNSLGNLSWQLFYNKDLAESVYSYFEHDFLYFNYDKNSWKNGTS